MGPAHHTSALLPDVPLLAMSLRLSHCRPVRPRTEVDWAGASAGEIVAVAHTPQPGGIILMRDWPPNTILAVPLIARDLAVRGLCPGRIAYTSQGFPFGSQVFPAIAVKP